MTLVYPRNHTRIRPRTSSGRGDTLSLQEVLDHFCSRNRSLSVFSTIHIVRRWGKPARGTLDLGHFGNTLNAAFNTAQTSGPHALSRGPKSKMKNPRPPWGSTFALEKATAAPNLPKSFRTTADNHDPLSLPPSRSHSLGSILGPVFCPCAD